MTGPKSHSDAIDRQSPPTVPQKPILNVAHKRNQRSKSVSFENPDDRAPASPNAPMDLSKKSAVPTSTVVTADTNATPSTSNHNSTGSNDLPTLFYDSSSDDDNSDQMPPNQDSGFTAADVLVFQNRIDDLIKANLAKINRIKELTTERDTLLDQLNGLHRINRSLTETIDLFRADENGNSNSPERIAELEAEIANLRRRIQRLNRENFDLAEDNDQLKAVLQTHSQKVLSEHNYNL